MYINGKTIRDSQRDTIAVINPATEEIIQQVIKGNARDAEQAVEAARQAFPAWSRLSALKRARMMHDAASKIRVHHDELVRLLTQEEGKPLPENEEEIWWSEETIDYYAEIGRHHLGSVIPPADPDQFNFIRYQPWGVVGCIVPWNYPILLLVWKLAPALAAGNTLVIKPSKFTPLTTLKMVELAFDHFPPGVINVVTGYGSEVGEALVKHPDVPMIAFTGSLAVGQMISGWAGPQMKQLHLELGGKDPMVIAPDADLNLAVRGLAYSGLINTGQVCTSTERVYVHESIFSQFTEALADFVGKLKLGNGLDEDTDIGPMRADQFRTKVEEQLKGAVKTGAKILVGGERPAYLPKGFFLEPSVVVNVDHSMELMREETFGPVIPVMPYKTFDQAIELANDCQYGLGACLLTNDAKLVKQFYEQIQAGTVWINDPLTDNFAGPFGGMKMSGLGRELGIEGFNQFCQVKHVHWDIGAQPKDFWYPYGNKEENV